MACRMIRRFALYFVALAGLFASPAFAQSTYPTAASGNPRVAGVVPLLCNASGANCAPAPGDTVGQYVVEVPSALPANGTTQFASSSAQATAGNAVVKASGGNLYGVTVVGGAGAGFLLVFNATTVPADGAVAPTICIPVGIAGYVDLNLRGQPTAFTTGISIAYSSTGCFTKTVAAAGFFRADFK